MKANFLPYGRQQIDEEDIQAVVEVLKSEWLTTGPTVGAFEKKFCEFTGANHAVAVANGTAALHCAMFAANIQEGDEVIVPTLTFAASANSVLYQKGKVVFADVQPDTLLLDPKSVENKVTSRTKAIVAVDYAGQPCDYDELQKIANRHNLLLISDAAHALGASYKGRKAGTYADLSTFSFHPVKHLTTGEGGMITTNKTEFDKRLRTFRGHGITTEARQREEMGTWYYEMQELGFNYRINDIQCALGISQIKKQSAWIEKRRALAKQYRQELADLKGVSPQVERSDREHAYHLFVVQLELEKLSVTRNQVFQFMREQGIGVNVHYIPVHLHPYYRNHQGTKAGLCPVAEAAYERILSLPMFPGMEAKDVSRVVSSLQKALLP